MALALVAALGEAKDLNLQRQYRDGKGFTADGGLTLDEGQSVSFDATGKPATAAGFWKGLTNKLYTAQFFDDRTNSVAIVEFQGTIRWDAVGKFSKTEDDFKPVRIKTLESNDEWVDVAGFALKGGELQITAKTGHEYIFSHPTYHFKGKGRRIENRK